MLLTDFVPAGAERPGRSGDDRVDGLISRYKWSDPVISYGFPDESRDYERDYWSDEDHDGRDAPDDKFEPLRWDQMDVVRAALENSHRGAVPALQGFSVEGFTGLDFDFGGRGTGSVDIRVANSDDPDGAYAFYPGSYPEAGDVWFGGLGRRPQQGNDDQFTILHEIGHALGLKHGHGSENFGRIPKAFDSNEFSVMTYRSFVGADPRDGSTIEEYGSPQSFMMLDIAALQHLYGADFEVNAGNTVYSWEPGSGRTFVNGEVALDPVENIIFATIWDGGGRDIYDLSRYRTDLDIDLRPGGHSEFSFKQSAWLGGGPNDGFARGNIFNALQFRDDPRSLIEKAVAGRGDDRLRGNDADNRLLGNGGDDILIGGRGSDALVGGRGADLLMGGRGADIFVFRDALAFRAGGRGQADRGRRRGGICRSRRAGRRHNRSAGHGRRSDTAGQAGIRVRGASGPRRAVVERRGWQHGAARESR